MAGGGGGKGVSVVTLGSESACANPFTTAALESLSTGVHQYFPKLGRHSQKSALGSFYIGNVAVS